MRTSTSAPSPSAVPTSLTDVADDIGRVVDQGEGRRGDLDLHASAARRLSRSAIASTLAWRLISATLYLLGVEPRELAEPAGQLHGVRLVLTAEAAEAEQLVDHPLELEGALARSGSVSVRRRSQCCHLHVRDSSAASSPAELEDGIAGHVPNSFIVLTRRWPDLRGPG